MNKDEHNPRFKIICPKCNGNNCVMNAQGEPIHYHLESGTETGIKMHVQYRCKDCGYVREFPGYDNTL